MINYFKKREKNAILFHREGLAMGAVQIFNLLQLIGLDDFKSKKPHSKTFSYT
jgi:hypothetical protein